MKGLMKKSIASLAMAGLMATSAMAATYTMGFSGAKTGPTSDAGLPYSLGVEDYCNYINDTKMLGGDKVKCIVRDDGYKTDKTKQNFEEYLDDEIVAFFGYSTGSTLALAADFDENKIAVIPASMHADNLKKSSHIFLPIASYSAQVLGLAEYVANHHKGSTAKVAMFIHPSAFGRAPVNDLKKAIKVGLNVELIEVVEHGKSLDNTAMLSRLKQKGVQYIISQTVQAPVSGMLKDARRLGLISKKFGQKGKITFMGAHYTGGNDLISLAGKSAENFFWTTSYKLASEKSAGSRFIAKLVKTYKRDSKTGKSHNYTNGVMVVQIVAEAMKRAKAANKEITRATVVEMIQTMHGKNAFHANTVVGPVTYSATDHAGVDTLQLYRAKKGVFRAENKPFIPVYTDKIK